MGVTADGTTGAMNVVDYDHHEVHQGSHFFNDGAVNQAITTVYDIQITVPDTRRWIHMLWEITTEDETDIFFYENVVFSTAGTLLPSYNNNRNSSRTPGLVLKGIVNASVGNANADSVITNATLLQSHKSGSLKTIGITNRGHELVLGQGKNYLLRFVFTKAGWITWDINWYEHTNKAQVTGQPWSG